MDCVTMDGSGGMRILSLLRPAREISLAGLFLMREIRSLGIFQYIAVRRDDLITIGRRSHGRRCIENDSQP